MNGLYYDRKINTQKAKGIIYGLHYFMKNIGKPIGDFYCIPTHSVITNTKDLIKNNKFPCFARPCPIAPRHGFIDSKIITDRYSLKKMWKNVKKEDPNGEIVLGPYFKNIKYNMIYASNGIFSIGIGNDGATGGKRSVSFPVGPTFFDEKFREESGLNDKDTVYLEAIMQNLGGIWKLVQARGGPKVSSSSLDFIPKNILVKEIVAPINNLLKWESMVKSFKPGTVVYGKGHTLTSHAAIHCIINRIPFITSVKPKIGQNLLACEESFTKVNRTNFLKGVTAGMKLCEDEDNMKRLMYFSLSVIHNWAYIRKSNHADWLLGSASIVFLKICAALSFGEHRHHKGPYTNSRNSIYKEILCKGLCEFNKLPNLFKDFYNEDWEEGFGGIPWATCTWYSYMVWKTIMDINLKKTTYISDKEVTNLISIINKATNVAHNSGWWFNKFAKNDDLNFLARQSGLAASAVAHLYYECKLNYDNVKRIIKFPKLLKKIDKPFMEDKHKNIIWVSIDYDSWKDIRMIGMTMWKNSDMEKDATIKVLNDNNINKVNKYFKNIGEYRQQPIVIPLTKNGKFNIPGIGNKSIKKVFG
jgi:hypothetical protein